MKAGHSEPATIGPFPLALSLEQPRSMLVSQRSIIFHGEIFVSAFLSVSFQSLTNIALSEPPADVLAYIFPWVEAEEALLEARTKMSSLNRDIALKQFFRVLRWFRTVIIQDCALLYNAYPACPLFRYAPFSSPSFRSFAATAAATISAAEENARLAFYNLPEHMARSMKGYAADLQIRQEVQYGDVLKRFEAIEAHNARLESLMASRGPKGNRKVAQGTIALLEYILASKLIITTQYPLLRPTLLRCCSHRLLRHQ